MSKRNIKKSLITLAIAIIFVLFIGYGIEVFSPSPDWEDFCPQNVYIIDNKDECLQAGGEWSEGSGIPSPEGKDFCHEPRLCYQEFDQAEAGHNKIVFIITTIIGILTLILGFILKKEAAATGIVSGALLTILYGTLRYWRYANNTLKFTLLGIVLAVLIWIAYKKFEKK